jgi:Ran-binding protein 1
LVEEISESLTKNEGKESEDGSSTAGLLEKLTVSEHKSEETKADTAPAE